MLGLDGEKTRYALGIAASRTGGLTANSGTMTKSLHLGMAASVGLESALLAQRGLKSNPDIIEAPKGFAESLLSGTLDAAAFDNIGDCHDLLTKRYAIKLFPCQYTTHWGIDAARRLRAHIVDLAQITRIEIDMPDMAGVNRPNPALGLDGKFSVQYTIACALADGWVGIDHFTDDSVRRHDLQNLLSKIVLKIDRERAPEAAARWVEINMKLNDGSILKERCEKPEGHYHLPALTLERHRRKLEDCLSRRYDERKADEIIELASRFSGLSAVDLQKLTVILSA
jgi:aconitate decarboxylase